jgi:hypothetical protein
MRSYDQGSALFWLMIAIAVLVQSLRYGIGTLGNPGMGFMAFGASGVLVILSLGVLVTTSFAKRPPLEEDPFTGILWKRIIAVTIILFLYAWLMPKVGYLISTLLLMVLLFISIGKKEIWQIALISVLTAGVTYYVFSVLLNCQFPAGIFGF